MTASRSAYFSPAARLSLAQRAWTAAQAAWKAYLKWYEHRAAVHYLDQLDDRMLRDIGISRGEIEAVARSGRPLGPDRKHKV